MEKERHDKVVCAIGHAMELLDDVRQQIQRDSSRVRLELEEIESESTLSDDGREKMSEILRGAIADFKARIDAVTAIFLQLQYVSDDIVTDKISHCTKYVLEAVSNNVAVLDIPKAKRDEITSDIIKASQFIVI